MATTVPILYDLVAAYGSEAQEYQRLLFKGTARTHTGQATFQSTTGSLTFYDTDVGCGIPAEDAHIVGFAEDGLYYWLNLVLNSYNIAKASWDAIRTDFNDLMSGSVTGISLASGNYTLSAANYNKQVLVVTTGHASNAIILPTSQYKYFVINGDNTNNVLVKKNGGTPITIQPNKNAIVVYNGTDYEFVSKPSPAGDVVGTSDVQTLTNKTLTSPTINTPTINTPIFYNWDGWISANETWLYASATTITVPSGAANKYKKGDKIKWTQNSTVYYAYIVVVTDTLLTLLGNAVLNTATYPITNNYYSHASNPIGFPDYFDYTSTLIGFSSASQTAARYKIIENEMHFQSNLLGGTSNATTFTFTIPIAVDTTVGAAPRFNVVCQNSGTDQAYPATVRLTSTTAEAYLTNASAAWANTGNKFLFNVILIYRI